MEGHGEISWKQVAGAFFKAREGEGGDRRVIAIMRRVYLSLYKIMYAEAEE